MLLNIIYKSLHDNGAIKAESIFTNQDALENTYYIVQILAGSVMVLGGVIAVWQYTLSARAERVKLANDQIQKAIDLSEYYKDNVLTKFAILKYIFQESQVNDILVSIDPSRMEKFDNLELKTVLTHGKCDEIKEKLLSSKTMEAIINAERIFHTDLNINPHLKAAEARGETHLKPEVQHAIMSNFINSLLNNMEYFAMNFTHGTADESVVYQSLHQTYLEAVQLLYYNIARNNNPDGMQVFTNVTELYKTWHHKSRKRSEEQDKLLQKTKGSVVMKI